MGGTATMVAAGGSHFGGRIPAIILWAPGVHDSNEFPDEDYLELPFPGAPYLDEAGQRVRTGFWHEAADAGFFKAFQAYNGALRLVYGETDRFDPAGLRLNLLKRAEARGHAVTVLIGQDHSSWDYDVAQKVYAEEREFLRQHLA